MTTSHNGPPRFVVRIFTVFLQPWDERWPTQTPELLRPQRAPPSGHREPPAKMTVALVALGYCPCIPANSNMSKPGNNMAVQCLIAWNICAMELLSDPRSGFHCFILHLDGYKEQFDYVLTCFLKWTFTAYWSVPIYIYIYIYSFTHTHARTHARTPICCLSLVVDDCNDNCKTIMCY